MVITRPPDVIRTGMVLTLQVDDKLVTHRVVEVHPDGTFTTKGDANRARDNFSGNDVRVVGQFRGRLPLVGRLFGRNT